MRHRIKLVTLRRENQHEQLPEALKRLITRFREIIETVNGQLVEQFAIEHNYAHSFWGLCARLYTKLTAHTPCIPQSPARKPRVVADQGSRLQQ